MWVERSSLLSKNSIDSLIVELSKNNIKNLFVQIRSRGDALYYSDIVKMNSRVQKNFDPLAYILEWSKLLNINIYAWLNTYLIWSAPYEPYDEKHLYYTHPEWFATDYNGKSDIVIKVKNIQSPNWEGLYLSPNHPEVNIYIYNLVKEIITNYPDIDGIHFDYIRFQDEYYGFNKIGMKNFELNYNFNPKDIYRGLFSKKFGWSISEKDSIENLWINYNSDNITNLIRSVKKYIDDNNVEIELTAAVKSDLLQSKSKWYQDWGYWIENDILDFVVVMNYAASNDKFINKVRIINENLFIDNLDKKIIMGISLYNQDESSVADKIILTNLSGYNKICFFSYNSIKNKSNILNSTRLFYNKKKNILGE